jgi:hypothetical protein
MSLHKDCADHLRAYYRGLTGKKLGASHAHELVAAFFGYGTAAALRAETKFPLTAVGEADFLMPDLLRMEQRVQELRGLPTDLPTVDEVASEICGFLVSTGSFTGQIWQSRDLRDHVNGYVQDNSLMIEDALSGEIAATNAYFDELYVDEYDFQSNDDALVVTLTGSLNGEHDPDRAFHGDKIAFTTIMTFPRVSGRVAYGEPELDTDGEVDDGDYYDADEVVVEEPTAGTA